MRTKLVAIAIILLLMGGSLIALLVISPKEVTVEKPSTSIKDSWREKLAEITKDAKGETDPIPSKNFLLGGLAAVLLLTGAYLLYQRNNSNFLKNII